MASKIEVWLIGALNPIEIEGDLKQIGKRLSDFDANVFLGTMPDGETILIFIKNIAYLKSVKEVT